MGSSSANFSYLAGPVTLTFDWRVKSQSAETNTTIIEWDLGISRATTDLLWTGLSCEVVINGVSYSFTGDDKFAVKLGQDGLGESFGTSKILYTGTQEIPHLIDGTKTFNYYVQGSILRGTIGSDEFFNPAIAEISGSGSINRIKRYSTISCESSTILIGDTQTIYINNVASDATHTLTYTLSVNGETLESDTIDTNISNSTVSWLIPERFFDLLENTSTAACRISCDTFIDNVKIGNTSASCTVSTGNQAPEFTVTFRDVSGSNSVYTGSEFRLIRYATGVNLYYEITATPARGAKIDECKIVYGNKTYSGQPEYSDNSYYLTGYFSNSDHLTAAVTVTDSRGISATRNINLNMADYFYPTAVLRVTKPTTSGAVKLEFEGTHFNQSFGAQNNSFTLEYRFKEEGDVYYGSWIEVPSTQIQHTATTYSAVVNESVLDYTRAYIFQARITDSINTTGIESPAIKVRSTPVFDWGANDFAFNVPVSIQGDLTIQGNLVADYITAQGTTTVSGMEWHWTKWKSGKAECYGIKHLTSIAMSNDTSNTSTGGNLELTATVLRSGKQTLTFPTGLFGSVECLHLDLVGIDPQRDNTYYPCTWAALTGDYQTAIPVASINYCLLSTRFPGNNDYGTGTFNNAYVSCYIKGTASASGS